MGLEGLHMSRAQLLKNKSKIIVCFVFVISLLLIILLLGNFESRKNTANMVRLENPLLEELKVKNGTTFQIDSYTISLVDGVYEQNTQLGYLVFKVTNRNGLVEAEISSSNQLVSESFGKDGRFTISIMATHSRTVYAKYEGDVLYITYRFEITDYKKDIDDCIYLNDYKKISEKQEYCFSLDTVEKSKRVQMGKDGTIYISSLGFLIASERKYSIDDMKIVLSDGNEKEIIDKKKYSGEFASYPIDGTYVFVFNSFFDEVIDYSKIDRVVLNGNAYMVSD
jgi:hypothetical protein